MYLALGPDLCHRKRVSCPHTRAKVSPKTTIGLLVRGCVLYCLVTVFHLLKIHDLKIFYNEDLHLYVFFRFAVPASRLILVMIWQ